ncbi:MAG: DUF167 domain-containing protein [Micavibrio aeruginosavorus]|uniref:UPF0235 protein DI551_01360 n=1 Tax=Micavibrio aeruginosavorus TaxID=349221 RepID=A0A2W5N6C8_9BACT|nr:MAG: DUF167 domain-containing protein [Micavibrio aeruginosavorus]
MGLKDDLTALVDDRGLLHVHVTPKASAERIKIERRADSTVQIRIYVTCAPEDGKANKAVIALLSKTLAVPKTSLTVLRGDTARDKTIMVQYPH